ncbi:hypothetical protein DFH09DRAFT_974599 [Mycena vulgaris]|nr:hypothetical protein DFH09DRAFT_974599 [Mycena vulgaris]
MSSHRNHSNKHALPPNPTFIDFTRSDGDPTLWPQNTTREVDQEGHVNYMQPVGLDEPLSVKWRVGVGDAISVALKLTSGQPHVLRDFPSGYRMFDHHKGKADNPRHDVYLFGSDTKARFRSVPEFIPHALWLMGDGSDQCKCKYCSKKPQREITSSMGNLLRNSQSPSPSRPSRPKPEKFERKKDVLKPRLDRLQNPKVYAAVQKNNIVKPSPHIQTKNIMLVERNNNVRDACRPPSEGGVPRWFREGELVWCALQAEISGPRNTEEDVIKFWPAIVDEVKLSIHAEAQGADKPWVPRQNTVYKVQFLAISRSYIIPDSMVIPYQSHIVPAAILREMAERPVDDWDLSTEKLANFDPCPPPPAPVPAFVDTLTPLAVALQIASMFSAFWCLTDDWEAKLSVAPGPTRPIQTLPSAIESASANNAYVGSISSGPNPSRGQIPPPPARFLSQSRFQGIWWGGERIWADDLVRLKVPRSCLAPAGAQQIFAPSGVGKRKKAAHESDGRQDDPAKYGAIARGVFMKIETIFVVDGGVGAKRECRVSGMLYELADLDWEDPNLPRNVESISTGPSAPSAGPSAKFPGPASSGETPYFPLPPPPTGYKFRPILAPGHESVMSLSLISGRYYHSLLQHPLLKPYLTELIPSEDTTVMNSAHLFALEGLFGGYKNSVDPSKHKPSREKMISDATKEAMAALEDHIKERRRLIQMEID